jgi:hypothetical protein
MFVHVMGIYVSYAIYTYVSYAIYTYRYVITIYTYRYVRQGSVLSPYLFNVYVDKISVKLNNCRIGCKINDVIVNHLFYADDLCIFCPSSFGLQTLINVCLECGSVLDIIFQKRKCKVMVFKSGIFKHCLLPCFYLNGDILEVCNTYKYLGHVISNDGSDDLDIQRQYKSVYAKGNSLTRAFSSCSTDVKSVLFKSFCSSLYTCQLWSCYKQSTMKKLHVAYHSSLKFMLNVPRNTRNSLLFVSNKIRTLQELIRNYTYSFRTRLFECNNYFISHFVRSKDFMVSDIFLHWQKILS